METNAGATILCVDDDDLFLSVLSGALVSRGYTVISCESAQRALESLAHARPDLAIVDVMMPGMDGLDLTRRIRSLSKERIPVVLLSAVAGEGAIRRGMDAGARLYLTKPCSLEEITESVRVLLREQRGDVVAEKESSLS